MHDTNFPKKVHRKEWLGVFEILFLCSHLTFDCIESFEHNLWLVLIAEFQQWWRELRKSEKIIKISLDWSLNTKES